MLPAAYKERARRLLDAGGYDEILPRHKSLFWRTHDAGLLEFETARCDTGLRDMIVKQMRSSRPPEPERAAIPVDLVYSLKQLAGTAKSLSSSGSLPGEGCLVKCGDTWVLGTRDPEACLAHVLEVERREQKEVLGRLLGNKQAGKDQDLETGSCGRCGLLGGNCNCIGGSCVNNGRL